MKKNLLLKFAIAYFVFAALSFALIATFSYNITYNSNLKTEAASLRKRAGEIALECANVEGSNKKLDDSYIETLSWLAKLDNLTVWIMKTDGAVTYDSDGTLTGSLFSSFNPADAVGTYRVGNFYEAFAEEKLSVYMPIIISYKTVGYVLIHEPVSIIASASDNQLRGFYYTFGIILLLSFGIIVVFVVAFLRPIRKIEFAAEQYAAGNLKYDLHLKGHGEMRYLGDTLNYMAHELDASEDYQRQFISNVSHDFRSPLTSIKGYLVAIKDGTIPPESQEKYIDIVISETERLTGLTYSLSQLNSVSASSFQMSPESFDINEIVRQVAESFGGQCIKKGINFNLNFADESSVVVADKAKIQQVIYNLVDNAIKFSHSDSSIDIEIFPRGEKYFVSVKDYGEGISKENLKRIWTRFYKTDSSRGKDKKGTGLGLAIVKEIINAHGEFIDVISTEGVGTEFIFSLKSEQ